MNISYYCGLIEKTYPERFEEFRKILLEYNNKFNLTSITEEKDVKVKHFLDSIAGEAYFPLGAKVVEIGSGGGFPSVPLKIVRDDLNFLLIESTAKKCSYLQAVVDKLAFCGVDIKNCRAEDAAKDNFLRESFDVAEARAVARLNVLCEYCLPFVKTGGRFIAYKGECEEELLQAANAVRILGGEIENVEKYSLTDGEKRTLIIIKKVRPTPAKYPRGQGKERKCPLI